MRTVARIVHSRRNLRDRPIWSPRFSISRLSARARPTHGSVTRPESRESDQLTLGVDRRDTCLAFIASLSSTTINHRMIDRSVRRRRTGTGMHKGDRHDQRTTTVVAPLADGRRRGGRRRRRARRARRRLRQRGPSAPAERRQLPGDAGVELRVHQPRHDEPVLHPDAVRHRRRLGAARHDVAVDRLGDLRHPRDGQRFRSGDRRQGRRHRRGDRRPGGIQRPDPRGSRRRHSGGLVQRRCAQRPHGLRRTGPLRFGRGDGPAHRRDRRRGQGRPVHRHARSAQHPAAHRRGDPGDPGLGRQHRVRAGRDERRASGGAQPHRSLVPRQHRRRRHVRRRCRQHARESARSCRATTPARTG